MSKIPKIIWDNWIKPLALYAILWAGFHYWLDFGNAQSIVFAFFFGSCYFEFTRMNKDTEKADDFVPYRVTIQIHNQRGFLFKYKFANAEEEWNQICERVDETSILRRGYNFTVLSLNKNGLPHLTWLDDYKVFVAGLPSFEGRIQGLEFPSKFSLNGKESPLFYFGYRHGKSNGYTIALRVPDDWWEKNKTENVETNKEYDTGSIYLIFGVLPYGEIGLDYKARHQDRKIELEKLGWTIKDQFETIEVRNEYFSVSQQFLETD